MSAIAWDGAAFSTVIVRLVRNCALERTIQYSRDISWPKRQAAAYWMPRMRVA